MITLELLDNPQNPVDINFFEASQKEYPIVSSLLLKLSSELRREHPNIYYVEYFTP